MSSNFYDTSGSCTGIDAHMYLGVAPPLPPPIPCEMVPHIIFWKHSWKSRDWRIATKVTTCGNPVLQSNWAMLCVLHAPIPVMLPHPIEIAQLEGIIVAGSATPQLTAHKVTGQGGALCVEISGTFGLNLDCGDYIALSKDFNTNTVVTQPTRGDYVAAVLSAALSFAYAYGANWAIGKKFPGKKGPDLEKNIVLAALSSVAVAIVQTVADNVNSQQPDGSWKGDVPAIAISKTTAWVQQLVDGEK